MEKGRMIYVDESGKKLVTRMLICDMRPVRSSCGMHIVLSLIHIWRRAAGRQPGTLCHLWMRADMERQWRELRQETAEGPQLDRLLMAADGAQLFQTAPHPAYTAASPARVTCWW